MRLIRIGPVGAARAVLLDGDVGPIIVMKGPDTVSGPQARVLITRKVGRQGQELGAA
jgi:hypothetical protein